MIRRSQTLRTHSYRPSLVPRPSPSPSAKSPPEKPLPSKPTSPRSSDCGVLEELVNDSFADSVDLTKRITELDLDLAKLRDQNRRLSQRPTRDQLDDLEKEYKTLELILDGTQRENAKCMEEIKIRKERERILEDALRGLMGPSWAQLLNIAPSEPISRRTSLMIESTALVLPSLLETPLLEQSESMELEDPPVEFAHSTLISAPQNVAPPRPDSTLASVLSDVAPNPATPCHSLPGSVGPSPRPSLAPDTTASTVQAPQMSMVDMERRLCACETAIKTLMGNSRAGELSIIRDELEVEGLMGSL